MAEQSSVSTFLIKTSIVVAAIVGVMLFVEWKVQSHIESIQIGGRAFWTAAERKLENLADDDMSPAKKQKILKNLKTLGDRYRPFIDAVIGK